MKKTIPFALLIIALVLVNCSGKKAHPDIKSEDNDKIALQALHLPKSGEDTLKASYFADTLIYVPLETTKESFIYNINQLWISDSIILIYCPRAGLLMFQQNGKFVRKIGKQGKGPGEYGNIYHFDVIRDTIYISSTVRRGFLRYTFDGTFCDEIKLNYEPVYFSTTADQKLTCYVQEEGKVLVYNKNLYAPDTIVVEYGVTKGRYYYSLGDHSFMTYFQKTLSDLLFNDYLNDTVWKIRNEKKEPAFILDMKDKLLPRDKHIEFCKGDFQGWEKMAKSYQLVHLIPFSSWMFVFQKHWLDTKYDAIYLNNTKTGEIKKFSTSYIYDDIVSKQKLSYVFFMYSADYLVVEADPLKVLKDMNKNNENSKEIPSLSWLNQMKTVNKDDNPIIVKIKIKKNL
ncbi:MAG TPA: 6-bladed beta-propeller [Bacteroidales bacterium]|nr:6-bladed beta-propeller [Bacteroidales bacterium]